MSPLPLTALSFSLHTLPLKTSPIHTLQTPLTPQVFYHHYNRSGYVVTTNLDHFKHHVKTTKFCLAPPGGGYGHRQVLLSMMGCIPVIIGEQTAHTHIQYWAPVVLRTRHTHTRTHKGGAALHCGAVSEAGAQEWLWPKGAR